jgi:hypothetical protein
MYMSLVFVHILLIIKRLVIIIVHERSGTHGSMTGLGEGFGQETQAIHFINPEIYTIILYNLF